MRLVWKEHDEYNPVLVLVGVIFLFGGGYVLIFLPGSGLVWLIRAIFGIAFAMGAILLIRQFQLWRRGRVH
jgi:hypothetical protein